MPACSTRNFNIERCAKRAAVRDVLHLCSGSSCLDHGELEARRDESRLPYLLVGLDVPNKVIQGIKPLLDSEVELVMVCAQVLRHITCCDQVWSTLNADAESMQPLVGAVGVFSLLQMPAPSRSC